MKSQIKSLLHHLQEQTPQLVLPPHFLTSLISCPELTLLVGRHSSVSLNPLHLLHVDMFQYGLYSSFMACFVYTVFGSCKDSPVGPTAIMAILTRENLHDLGPQGAILLCFLTGCVQLLMGVLQLGMYKHVLYLFEEKKFVKL